MKHKNIKPTTNRLRVKFLRAAEKERKARRKGKEVRCGVDVDPWYAEKKVKEHSKNELLESFIYF